VLRNYGAGILRSEMTALADFIGSMMKIDPSERARPSTLLQHEWLYTKYICTPRVKDQEAPEAISK